ncbi:matrixin family metalloprotease [Sandaracinus amylolyticus]|uniref:matrixin family metalloprotease n=1 Tax=Sandaracinus amylolyticus TaxID=927083 RepID=UPI0012EDADAB|nr:matrixin family metalloprotease [Sandaracinus amylolyticus]
MSIATRRLPELTLAIGVSLALLTPTSARAYRTVAELGGFDGAERVVWLDSGVRYSTYDVPPEGFDLEDMLASVREGSAAWTADCSRLALDPAGRTSVAAASGDRRNTIAWLRGDWRELGLSSDVAATTDILYERAADGTWHIVEADILFNDSDFDWSAHDLTPVDARDVRAVAVHEFGHFLGLSHVCEEDGGGGAPLCAADDAFADVVMYPFYRGPDARSLAADDVAGLCSLYPSSGCAFDSDCDAGARCVDGACVPSCATAGCPVGFTCSSVGCVPDPCASCGERCDASCSSTEPGRALGQPCGTSDECRSGRCATDGYCTAPCGDGVSCPTDWVCASSSESCEPTAGVFGDSCGVPGDCHSRLCLERGATATCTDGCAADGDCPRGYACELVEGIGVCAPTRSGGCAVAMSAGASSSRQWLLWTLVLASWHGSRRLARRRAHRRSIDA